ncbi:MAG TPA: leucyl aminopeptidase [Thermoanaerobaculia bacterium]|nr:leucyl aminopeptidase [Thermoanaerobaculia bacterium]
MARVIWRPTRKFAEIHYFLPEKGPAPRGLGRKTPDCPGETIWIDAGRPATLVHRYKKEPNLLAALRGATRQAAVSMQKRGAREALFLYPREAARLAAALLPHVALADYDFHRYRSSPVRPRLVLGMDVEGAELPADDRRAAEVAAEMAEWARDLGNTPANDLGSPEFTAIVRAAARRDGLRFRSLSPPEIRREGMGGVLGVASGSRRPPGFLILTHRPRISRGSVVLVGKGITFDSGGISIKGAASMGEMKFDMMGAATALAIVRAARRLNLPVAVTALAPLAENVPSGTSYRPGDILRMRNGKTVEVDNTDAEGRLIMADALSYAAKFRPDAILDFATLTGAVLVALGQECAGVMGNDDGLVGDLLAAGEKTGDRFWRLPLWDEYRELLKSEYADMKNSGGRYGGTVSAAIFLKEFVPAGVPWAHCDVAGTAHLEKARAGYPAGATGFGIAPTIELLRARYGRARRVRPRKPTRKR